MADLLRPVPAVAHHPHPHPHAPGPTGPLGTRTGRKLGGQPRWEPAEAQGFIALHTRTEQDRLHPLESPVRRRRQVGSDADLPPQQRGPGRSFARHRPRGRLDLAGEGSSADCEAERPWWTRIDRTDAHGASLTRETGTPAPTPSRPGRRPTNSWAPQLQPPRQLLLKTISRHPAVLVMGDVQSSPRAQETVVAVIDAQSMLAPRAGNRRRHPRSRRHTVQAMVGEELPQLALLHLWVTDPFKTQTFPVHPDSAPPTRFPGTPGYRTRHVDLENSQQKERNTRQHPDRRAPEPLQEIARPHTRHRFGRPWAPLCAGTAGNCAHPNAPRPRSAMPLYFSYFPCTSSDRAVSADSTNLYPR